MPRRRWALCAPSQTTMDLPRLWRREWSTARNRLCGCGSRDPGREKAGHSRSDCRCLQPRFPRRPMRAMQERTHSHRCPMYRGRSRGFVLSPGAIPPAATRIVLQAHHAVLLPGAPRPQPVRRRTRTPEYAGCLEVQAVLCGRPQRRPRLRALHQLLLLSGVWVHRVQRQPRGGKQSEGHAARQRRLHAIPADVRR